MRALIAALLTVATAGCANSDQQIECPAAESGQAVGTLHESPGQIKATGDRLGRGTENEIAEVASRLRERHTGATKDEIVNYLVTAYCPKINREKLDKAAKQQLLQSFSARAEKIVRSAS